MRCHTGLFMVAFRTVDIIKLDEIIPYGSGHTAVGRKKTWSKIFWAFRKEVTHKTSLAERSRQHRARPERVLLQLAMPKHGVDMVDDPFVYSDRRDDGSSQAFLLLGVQVAWGRLPPLYDGLCLSEPYRYLSPPPDSGQLGPPGHQHKVDDVAAARTALEERGVQFRGDILDTGVCHMAFFADPDGNALMLHHRYAPRASDAG